MTRILDYAMLFLGIAVLLAVATSPGTNLSTEPSMLTACELAPGGVDEPRLNGLS